MFDERNTLIPSLLISDGVYVKPRRIATTSLNLRCSQVVADISKFQYQLSYQVIKKYPFPSIF
jgi:hypothetical protein